MSVSAEDFKDVMSRVAATVTVVTVKSEAGPIGLTVSAFVSVSADPPIVLVCLDKATNSLEAMLDVQGFTVNIMPEGTEDIAMLFATVGRDRFAETAWSEAVMSTAGPVLDLALAHLECEVVDRVEIGDHWVIYGEVAVAVVSDRALAPLVWFDRRFVRVDT